MHSHYGIKEINEDFEYYEEANEIVYRDLSAHIAICATPCFKPNTDYKYFLFGNIGWNMIQLKLLE